jgi:hypothetical protein
MDKEKLVRDLVDTFNDHDQLHVAYKEKMKSIFFYFSEVLASEVETKEDFDLMKFIDSFVEERFTPHG